MTNKIIVEEPKIYIPLPNSRNRYKRSKEEMKAIWEKAKADKNRENKFNPTDCMVFKNQKQTRRTDG